MFGPDLARRRVYSSAREIAGRDPLGRCRPTGALFTKSPGNPPDALANTSRTVFSAMRWIWMVRSWWPARRGQTWRARMPAGYTCLSRRGQNWSETALLVPDRLAANDRLGMAVVIDGDTIAAGAPYATTRGGGFAAGAVYVYRAPGRQLGRASPFDRPGRRPI